MFRDEGGSVLYIGKAKSLRSRVRCYFQKSRDARLGTTQLVDRVADLETIVTGTEVEALHLEQNLVKRHRPPFNVRLRDDKSFPYIAVTVEDEYPRVMFTRERHRRGVVYFGPFANAKKVRETLDVLNRVFKFRPCEGPKPGRHSGIPCLDYHIDGAWHRAWATCRGRLRRRDRRRDRLPERRHADDRPRAGGPMQAAAAASGSRTPHATATACSRSATSPSGRRPTGARSARSTSSGSPRRGTRRRCRSFRSATAS